MGVREGSNPLAQNRVQPYCRPRPQLSDAHSMTDLLDRLKSAVADRYTIQQELGRGGMAVVYLAHDQKLNRPVALKVLRPELAASLGGERFLREIEIAAKLTHPNILALYDCGEADGQLYYTMPFVEGESLRDRLNREKQLPIDDALQITKEVADAGLVCLQAGRPACRRESRTPGSNGTSSDRRKLPDNPATSGRKSRQPFPCSHLHEIP